MDTKIIIVLLITTVILYSCQKDEYENFPIIPPTEWIIYDIGSHRNLFEVFFIDTLVGWTISSDLIISTHRYINGEVFKTFNGGLSWVSVAKFDFGINDIYFVNEYNGWLVGERGRILKTTDGGSNWTLQYKTTSTRLEAIHFINQNVGWVGGGGGAIYKTRDAGDKWIRIETNISSWIYDIWFINEKFGCFSSEYLYNTVNGGLTWDKTESYIGLISDLFFIDANHGWGVGQYGTIVYTNDIGKNWHYQKEFPREGEIEISWLSSVFFIDRKHGWSVGYNYILSTQDGGENWITDSVDQSIMLNDIFFVGNQGWIVGNHGILLKSII